MEVHKITDDFSVAPQITPDDVAAIAGAGFRSILCNRPDGEEPGQAAYDDVADAARAAGLDARSVPIVSGVVRQEDAEAFSAAMREMPKPILAYCRSGTRCTMLWSISEIDERDADEILRLTRNAGYDMSGLLRQLGKG
ncbi:TIGR01244 family sulfur transferase [Roseovarius sp. SYSU LYC5161]|uniref:TIGR01244 family sulfur transferase n=1 Tax=Roseovarius halophilus (ex Wu et al. 2025) TaxID=3376060 RepID=UPI0028720559|nr:TIGR01244 family sulfur transferase [Roseovarius sp.]